MSAKEMVIRTVKDVQSRAKAIYQEYSDKEALEQGILVATQAPYSADNTGKIDATKAIQRALDDARDTQSVCYLPSGTYLVSGTISGIQGIVDWDQWPYGDPMLCNPYLSEASFEFPNVIVGSRGSQRTILRLVDNAPGFDNPESPVPVLHFWARGFRAMTEDLDKPFPAISFNQKMLHLDIELGSGNPGAIGIDNWGAEGTTVEDVSIDATGAFAGVKNAPGSGGSMHAVAIRGGRFGLYIESSQPSPLISDFILIGQTQHSILSRSRGPLTLVGGEISGTGIKTLETERIFDGGLSLIDTKIEVDDGKPAVEAARSVIMENVWIKGAGTLFTVSGHQYGQGSSRNWTHCRSVVVPTEGSYGEFADHKRWRDRVWINGDETVSSFLDYSQSPLDPDDLRERHAYRKLPDFTDTSAVVNVKSAPYSAKGDGLTDDTKALQRAIDSGQPVFLPKGEYLVAEPLNLSKDTILFGISNLHTVLTTRNAKPPRQHNPSAPFHNPTFPDPVVRTIDDPEAATFLGMLRIRQPSLNPCVYALHWMAGRSSTVQNVYAHQSVYHPAASLKAFPLILVTGNGGGSWYNVENSDYWRHGPDYRTLLVEGTQEPMRIYHLQPQFNAGESMVEFKDAGNIDVYSCKSEGDYSLIWLRNCRNIRFFGLCGLIAPRPGREIIRLIDCDDILLTHINPMVIMQGCVFWGDFITFHLSECYLLRQGDVEIKGLDQFAWYKLGNPTGPDFSQ